MDEVENNHPPEAAPAASFWQKLEMLASHHDERRLIEIPE